MQTRGWQSLQFSRCPTDYRDLPRPGQKSQIIKATHKVAGEKFTNTLATPDFLKHIDVGAFD
jgi:hypothetical protein